MYMNMNEIKAMAGDLPHIYKHEKSHDRCSNDQTSNGLKNMEEYIIEDLSYFI